MELAAHDEKKAHAQSRKPETGKRKPEAGERKRNPKVLDGLKVTPNPQGRGVCSGHVCDGFDAGQRE